MERKIKVLVLSGGPSNEHEVSLASGKNVFLALNRKKYDSALYIISKRGNPDKSVLRAAKRCAPDLVFIALHGAYGEDGKVQKMLDKISIPYTGSGSLSSVLAMDKLKSAGLFRKHGLTVPRVLNLRAKLKFPFVVKPVDSGSSVGVSIVTNPRVLSAAIESARKVSRRIMAQEYIKGREVTCGILENSNGKPFALPPTEILPNKGSFFDYRSKYIAGASREVTPARFSLKIIKAIQNNALIAHKSLGCRGVSRTDMIIQITNDKLLITNGGRKRFKIYVLETNTIPGMTKTSLLPQGAKAAGISFPLLLDALIKAALSKN